MDTAQKLDVLLKEHDQLRTQINEHTRHLYALLGVVLGVITFLIQRNNFGPSFWFILVPWLGAAYYFYKQSIRNTERCAYRLIVIEHQVNELAGGELLLQWELRWGCHAIGRHGNAARLELGEVAALRAWLRGSEENRDVLRKWLLKEGISTDPEILVYAKEFAEHRVLVVRELAIPQPSPEPQIASSTFGG
jgi:hypothetical protein